MTTGIIKGREVQTVIQAITPPSTQKAYFVIEVSPAPPLKWPIKHNVLDGKLMEGLKVGDSIILTFQRGKPKKANPQEDKDWYQDIVGITRVQAAPEIPPTPSDKAQDGPPAPGEASRGTPGPKTAPGEGAFSTGEVKTMTQMNRMNNRASCIHAACIRLPRGTTAAEIKRLALELFNWVIEEKS